MKETVKKGTVVDRDPSLDPAIQDLEQIFEGMSEEEQARTLEYLQRRMSEEKN